MVYRGNQPPCLHCHPQSYIRMVQHLIERCLLFHMTRDDCIKALEDHAGVQPLVTLTVWKELLKENKDYFQAYSKQFLHGASATRDELNVCNSEEEISGGES